MIGNFFVNFINGFVKILAQIFNAILAVLPLDPFQGLTVSPLPAKILGYMNWCFPFALICVTLVAWVSCLVVWYAVSALFRITQIVE